MTISSSSNHSPLAPTLAALLLVCAAGGAALYLGTMGFAVVSTEDARRLAVLRQPLATANVAIHAPQAERLAAMLRDDGRVTIVSFVYSSCNTVCSVLGSEYQQLQEQIRRRGLAHQIRLLSISFDPRDTPDLLTAYARRQQADPAVWRMAGIDQDAERQALLDAFGVVVLKSPDGEFEHNAAFHLIDRQGQLVRIMDFDDPAAALNQAILLAGGKP
ncbi:SCO family protein [Duganella aquatilis]|nr:SCO family protein [Duganella aquatilis]